MSRPVCIQHRILTIQNIQMYFDQRHTVINSQRRAPRCKHYFSQNTSNIKCYTYSFDIVGAGVKLSGLFLFACLTNCCNGFAGEIYREGLQTSN